MLIPMCLSGEEEQSIQRGWTRQQVIELLGTPNARIETANYAKFFFDRGEVEFIKDHVSSFSLISPEQLRELQEAEAVAAAENTRRGEGIRDHLLEDFDFLNLPATRRLAFWEDFQRRYPDVAIYLPLEKTRIEARAEEEKAREEERLATLEARVRSAEAQAARAEKAAREAADWDHLHRLRSSRDRMSIRYVTGARTYVPVSFYHTPVRHKRVCPRTGVRLGVSFPVSRVERNTMAEQWNIGRSRW